MSHMYALHDYDEELKKRGCFPINNCDAHSFNKKHYGIFFSVNSFNTSRRGEDNLKKINFWFIDMDEGSKEYQSEKIMQFSLVPSMVIETNKGHHVYWKCKEVVDVEDYKSTIESLVKHFDSDKNAKGVTRVLRVPGYLHQKDPSRPYKIKEIFKSEWSYTTDEINAALPVVEKPKEIIKPITTIKNSGTGNTFWKDVAAIGCRQGLSILSGAPELNSDSISFKNGSSGKTQIIINGKNVQSCWIDTQDQIGSHSNGGPYISNWVNWYLNDWAKTAEILKKYFPELQSGNNCLSGFGGIN